MHFYITIDKTGHITSSLQSSTPSPYKNSIEITKEKWESLYGPVQELDIHTQNISDVIDKAEAIINEV